MTVQSTEKTVTINGVPARIWVGESECGTPVVVFVTRIAVRDDAGPEAHAEFEAELETHAPPTTDVAQWPSRMFID